MVRDPELGLRTLEGVEDLMRQIDEPVSQDETCALVAGMRGWLWCQLGDLPEGVGWLEATIELLGRSDREPEPLATARLALLCTHVANDDAAAALATARAATYDSRYVDGNLLPALGYLAAGDLENGLPLVQAHAIRAATGRLSREANDSILLQCMLARAEGDDDRACALLPEARVSRSPGTIMLTAHLADILGVRAELDAARREVLDDRVEGGGRALAALRAEMARRGWSS